MRLSHWLIAAGVTASWLTRHSTGVIHDWFGYITLGLLATRLAWGFIGSPHARFTGFVAGPSATISYVRDLTRGRARRYLGHNPLGAWMALSLWSLITLICISGWMYTTDRWWGITWVGDTHLYLSYILLVLVGLHVSGVWFTSRHQHENLVAAMVHGRKRPAGQDDVA